MSIPAKTPDFETLALERAEEHVMIVRLNRPIASNALNTQMGRDLVRCFEDIALDPASTSSSNGWCGR
jgi:enoyl-CoA hydratase